MRTGRKTTVPLLRRADPEYQSWTIHDRPQGREDYQDGDRSLSNLWRDRPYQDVEQPHMDADPDVDAEESGKPAKRLSLEQVVRRAVMEMIAESEEDETIAESEEDDRTKYLDPSGAFSGPLWEKVAPLVNSVLDLMRMSESADQLRSKIQSSSISRKKLLLGLVDLADKFGFGYRTTMKDWDLFMQFVPSVTGLLKNEHDRGILEEALGQWVSENSPIKHFGFPGAPDEKDWGFKVFTPVAKSGGDAQEFYEGYVPGAVPRQETFNLKRIVSLAKGGWEDAVDNISGHLRDKMIVDFATARVNTRRLQSLLRYVTDQPDSQLAMAVVVGTLVREAVRQAGEGGEEAIRFDGGKVRLGIGASQLLSGMQGGTSRIIDEWLSMAVSMMRVVGVLPGDDPEPDEEDSTYVRADPSKYQSVKDRMRAGLAEIGLEIARKAIQGLHNSGGPGETPPDGGAPPDARALRRAIAAPAMELARDGKLGDAEARVGGMLEALDDALGDGDADAAARAAQELHGIASGLGASPASLSAAEKAIGELMATATPKAASVTVADIAKRIVAPAKVRVVTQDEAMDGIELDGGEALGLPSKYHAARRAIGGSSWASR